VIAGHWEGKSLPDSIMGIWRHKTGGFDYDILDWFSRGVLLRRDVADARKYYVANVTDLLKEVTPAPTPEQSEEALRMAGIQVPAPNPEPPSNSPEPELRGKPEKKTTPKWVDNPELAKLPFNPELCNCRKWNRGFGAQCNRPKGITGDVCDHHAKILHKIKECGGNDFSHGRYNMARPTHCLQRISGRKDLGPHQLQANGDINGYSHHRHAWKPGFRLPTLKLEQSRENTESLAVLEQLGGISYP